MAKAVRLVVLLRGINVGGNKKVPMAELRAVAAELGFRDVATYVQSGNLVGTAALAVDAAAVQMERALADRFGFVVPVVVRAGAEFVREVAACPFADGEPAQVHLGVSRAPLRAAMAKEIAAFATMGERLVVRGQVLWIDFVGGVGRSKLTSAVLDRVVGGVVTLRNRNSAQAIAGLVEGEVGA
jgi:uncharacterized protein (DUF1697 family)